MTNDDRWTMEALLGIFDEDLRRRRGVCEGTRGNYTGPVRPFLATVSPYGAVDPARIGVGDVVSFVGTLTCRSQCGTVELAAASLRSFFRFLRAQGLRTDRLEDAVPVVPHRRQVLPRYQDSAAFARLMACLDGSSPRGLRDRATILCVARLGAGEVVGLGLGDIDWRNATVRVRARDRSRCVVAVAPRSGASPVGVSEARAPGHRGYTAICTVPSRQVRPVWTATSQGLAGVAAAFFRR